MIPSGIAHKVLIRPRAETLAKIQTPGNIGNINPNIPKLCTVRYAAPGGIKGGGGGLLFRMGSIRVLYGTSHISMTVHSYHDFFWTRFRTH